MMTSVAEVNSRGINTWDLLFIGVQIRTAIIGIKPVGRSKFRKIDILYKFIKVKQFVVYVSYQSGVY